jgi:N-acetylglucosaminyldiphosphoundecaprenol N-acetyl-beta-D-mannosaminyltransferase
MLKSTKILNVNISNEKEEKVLEYLFERLQNDQKKTFIITPNPEMLIYASKHLDYQDKLNSADIALPDGVGLFFASGITGEPLQVRITGVDFLEKLCKEAREKPISMGFLGGRDGVAERAAERLLKKYPWLTIVFASDEWGKEGFLFKQEASSKELVASKKTHHQTTNYQLPTTTIDILFVAFGVPKQEEWIYQNLPKLPIKAAMGVGGAFDYFSGTVARAPYIVRFIGFEWLFRLIMQPWRWRRQMALLKFISLVVKQKSSKEQ